MGCNDRPHGRRLKDLLPRVANVAHLGTVSDAGLDVLQLLVGNLRVEFRSLLNDPHPQHKPNATDDTCRCGWRVNMVLHLFIRLRLTKHVKDTLPAPIDSQDSGQGHRDDCTGVVSCEGNRRHPGAFILGRPTGPYCVDAGECHTL